MAGKFMIILSLMILIILSPPLIMHSCTKLDDEPRQIGEVKLEMILISGGDFLMGKDGGESDNPVHEVHIDSFYLDKYEVTNAEYYKYCSETEAKLPEYWSIDTFHCGLDYPDHPVVGVSYYEASAYAEWAGKRLPTEAEWEYAARGGLAGKDFAHGDEIDTALANYFIKDRIIGTVLVGSYPPNGFGLHDMTGNVVEWTNDFYDDEYYLNSPKDNPQGPEKGKFRAIRGGGWHSGPYCCKVHFRNAIRAGWRDINIGFRCAKDFD